MKINKQQLCTIGSIVLTLAGMLLSSKAQEEEMKEMKEQIKMELIEEKEK